MSDLEKFSQTDIPGDMYTRAKKVHLNNPRGDKKSAVFELENVINLANGEKILTDGGILISDAPETATEASEVIDLIDLKGNILGQMRRGDMMNQLMLFLNSEMVYRHRQNILNPLGDIND